jgi:hypothetical protein
MDLCINRDDNGATMMEVRDELHIMANAKTSSSMAARFHESLSHVLKKHNVVLPAVESTSQHNGASIPTNDFTTMPLDLASGDLPWSGFVGDEPWQDFLNTAPDWSAQDWDSLLSDIDMQTL